MYECVNSFLLNVERHYFVLKGSKWRVINPIYLIFENTETKQCIGLNARQLKFLKKVE